MNKLLKLYLSIFLGVLIAPNICFSQYVEWMYQFDAEVEMVPQFFWVDKEGHGYYNIAPINPVKSADRKFERFLLMLDEDGQYKGTTYIRHGNRNIQVLPFGENRMIASGYEHFTNDGYNGKHSRVYDYKGNLLKTGAAIPGLTFSRVWTKDHFTFFTEPGRRYDYSSFSIGQIDQDLAIHYDTVAIESLARKDLFLGASDDPVHMPNGNWIIPMDYGPVEDEGMTHSPQNALVLGVKDNEIIWTYPDTLSRHSLDRMSSYKDKIGVLIGWSAPLFVLLDQNGEELKHFRFITHTGLIKDMVLHEDFFALLSDEKLIWYDLSGNVLAELLLSDYNLNRGLKMRLLPDGAILFTGTNQEHPVIVKVRLEDESITSSEVRETKQEEEKEKVSYTSSMEL